MNIERSIKLAIKNIQKEGLTDIFDEPFEIEYLKNRNSNIFISKLESEIKSRLLNNQLGKLKIHPLGHVLFPKKEAFDFRKASLLHPLDTLIYLSLVLQYADEIEKRRIPKNRKIVFSYRFYPKNGFLFDSKYNFTSFNKEVVRRINQKKNKILVKCDISNFYDRLNLHRLESTLLSILPMEKHKLINLTNQLLLFWANRDSYSLPVGGNASRILAEAALISVDDYLLSHKINFCRFVDDYRFFAPNIETAHEWLTILVERLYLEGLTINPLKTVIEDISLSKKDFLIVPDRVKENKQDRIIVGYSGTIPTKFRKLSDKEVIFLRETSIDPFLSMIDKNQILSPNDIKKFIKLIIAKNEFSKINYFIKIMDKFPQFIPLIIDVLIKKAPDIYKQDREMLKDYFSRKIVSKVSHPEYIIISIVKLLGSEYYKDISTLMELFRNLKRNAGVYIGRVILDSLYNNISRTEAIEIRQYFNRADLWEKRAIIRLVMTVLPKDEVRPWLKNIKTHLENDLFSIEIIDSKN